MTLRPLCLAIAVVIAALMLTAPRAAAYVTWDESIHGPLPAATASSSALVDDIWPVTDGSIYSASSAVANQFILVSASVQGALEFAALDAAPYLAFHLALNPYALPLFSPTVDVYGYGNADGAITGADYNAGVFLGTLTLPPDLGYGQDAFFNVTGFVRSVPGAYFGFNLRTETGTDVFSSLEYNYGKPSRLVGTPVPEPSTCALLLLAAAFAWWLLR
jgi:hypothetical protein